VTNPFTIAVPQKIAGLPLFSGAPLRLVFFLVIFLLVCFFVIRHAKKVERNPQNSICFREDEALKARAQKASDTENTVHGAKDDFDKKQQHALIWFVSWVLLAMVLVISTARMPGISDLAFPLMTVLFLFF
jgi:uncharacterized ion transporter superfamily protein YfcC